LAIDERGLKSRTAVVFAHAAYPAIVGGLERKRKRCQTVPHMPPLGHFAEDLSSHPRPWLHNTREASMRLADLCLSFVSSCNPDNESSLTARRIGGPEIHLVDTHQRNEIVGKGDIACGRRGKAAFQRPDLTVENADHNQGCDGDPKPSATVRRSTLDVSNLYVLCHLWSLPIVAIADTRLDSSRIGLINHATK
jgi:hypothetical protein